MNYYPYSYPYGPMTPPGNPGYRFQQNPHMEPPFPSGSVITSSTPTGPPIAADQINPNNPFNQSPAAAALTMNYGAGGTSYLENILRLNRGKLCHVHMTFQSEGARIFTGILQTAGRDHIILSDPNTGHRFILLTVYLDFIEFPEEINYYYPRSNTLNIPDEQVLEDNPEILPLYYYNKAIRDLLIRELERAVPGSGARPTAPKTP